MHISEIYRKFIEINRKSIERLSKIKLNSAQAICLRHGANNINKPTIVKMIADRINSNFKQSPVDDKSRSGKTDEHNAPDTTDIR